MRFPLPTSLLGRILLLVAIGLALVFSGYTVLGLQAVRESTARTLQERLLIAQVTAGRVDDRLQQTARMLQVMTEQAPINPDEDDPQLTMHTLRAMNEHLGGFAYYMAMLNHSGRIVRTEPHITNLIGYDLSTSNCVTKVLQMGTTVTTRAFVLDTPTPTIAILVPTKDRNGLISGLVLATLNLSDSGFKELLSPLGIGQTGYTEIVDKNGVVLGTTRPERLFQTDDHGQYFATLVGESRSAVGMCHNCHSNGAATERREEVLAFAPLTSAPWGVAVRQSREEAFAYSDALQQRVLLFGISAFILAILSAWLLTRSVVKPIRTLTVACQRIAEGDLSLSLPPIPSIGGDELLTLAHSFEIMRARLEKSLEEIQRWTEQLEQRVQQRTKELEESQRQLVSVNQMLQSKEQARSELLRKIIVAQEEERRRIARELHDEMSQVLTALSVALEAAIMAPASKADDVKARLVATKSLVSGMLGEVQRMILDLRPSLLDDLGLIPAIDWYAESRLKASGIRVELETAGVEKRLPSELETVIFRLTQEAITNIAKHARAENVSISLEFKESAVVIDIEDDGCGFAVDQVLGQRKRNQAFGLLGMKERVDLFGGTLSIHSKPGEGTRLVVEIPISGMEPSNGENKGIAGRRSRHTEGRTTGSSRPL